MSNKHPAEPKMILVPLDLVQETCETFQFYANNHWAKGTPEGDRKATDNEAMARRWGQAMLDGVKAVW